MSFFEENNMENTIVPYVIYNHSEHSGSNIQYGSITSDKLYEVLIDILKKHMRQYDFNMLRKYDDSDDSDSDDDSNNNENENKDNSDFIGNDKDGNGYNIGNFNVSAELTCDECWSNVVSKTYIKTRQNDKRLCFMCNPDFVITQKIFLEFRKYLKRNREKCDIIYFKDGKWNDFEIV